MKTEVVCQVNGSTNGTLQHEPITTANVTVTYGSSAQRGRDDLRSDEHRLDRFRRTHLRRWTVSEARYIEVAVTDKYTPLFPIHFSFINGDGTYHLSATAGMRTQ